VVKRGLSTSSSAAASSSCRSDINSTASPLKVHATKKKVTGTRVLHYNSYNLSMTIYSTSKSVRHLWQSWCTHRGVAQSHAAVYCHQCNTSKTVVTIVYVKRIPLLIASSPLAAVPVMPDSQLYLLVYPLAHCPAAASAHCCACVHEQHSSSVFFEVHNNVNRLYCSSVRKCMRVCSLQVAYLAATSAQAVANSESAVVFMQCFTQLRAAVVLKHAASTRFSTIGSYCRLCRAAQ
jgi:hypothetical protein